MRVARAESLPGIAIARPGYGSETRRAFCETNTQQVAFNADRHPRHRWSYNFKRSFDSRLATARIAFPIKDVSASTPLA